MAGSRCSTLRAHNAVLLGVVLVALRSDFNVFVARWLALLMTVGIVVELAAAVALIV